MFTQINDRSNNLSSNRLGLLLTAAKYMDTSINTPLKKRGLLTFHLPPAPTKQRSVQVAKVSYTTTGPPKKRFKIDTTTVCKPSINITDKHDIKLRHKFSKCPVGSSHRVWECTDEIAMAATSSRRFQSLPAIQDTNMKQNKQQDDKQSFILHDKDDDKYINPVHSLIRRDIWEGFVVDSFKDAAAVSSKDTRMKTDVTTIIGRVARYNGTIGFRCRFCKHVPLHQRAPRSAVYPRSLERIYSASLRFQRDHIE